MGVFAVKKFLLLSALMGTAVLGGFACTKKTADRSPNDAPLPPPSAVPGATTPTDSGLMPPNEMPGQRDSTHPLPGDTTPMGEGSLPRDTDPAPGTNPSMPVPNNTTPLAPE